MNYYLGYQNPFQENTAQQETVQQETAQQETVQQDTPKKTLEAIQNISKKTREYSSTIRETMKMLRESNAIPEMAESIRYASFAVRDTVNDISETTKDLKKRGVIVDTAGSIETTLKSAEDSIAIVKELTNEGAKASPHTTKAVNDGIESLKKETNNVTGKVLRDVKTQVGLT